MTHTPGPWSTCGAKECNCGQIWGNDHPVAEVLSGDWGDDFASIRLVGTSLDLKAEPFMDQITYGHIPPEVAKANARLIAAAPDLLEALKEIKVLLASKSDYSICRDDGEHMSTADVMLIGGIFERADVAIAKAEGE